MGIKPCGPGPAHQPRGLFFELYGATARSLAGALLGGRFREGADHPWTKLSAAGANTGSRETGSEPRSSGCGAHGTNRGPIFSFSLTVRVAARSMSGMIIAG